MIAATPTRPEGRPATPGGRESPARRRLLDTAAALFYAEGVHAVGVDRIIAEAGVAKATFYHHFAAKDDLVRAYVEQAHHRQRQAVDALRETPAEPRVLLTKIFQYIGTVGIDPRYRGCPFINVAAEFPDPAHPVRQSVARQRDWFRGVLHDLLLAAGHPGPDRAAAILMVIRDGLVVGSHLDDEHLVHDLVQEAVTKVLDPSAR